MDIVTGKKKGTLIAADQPGGRRISSKKRWIAYFHRAQGSVTVDTGARNALVHKGRSLLPIGIRQLTGHFPMGSLINIKDENGTVFAKGLTDFCSDELELIMGHQTSEIADLLNECHYSEVIHRDNMVVLEDV